jgi:NADPH-dependent curcumin reductase CurA
MADLTSREIRLKIRPVGLPAEKDFELSQVTVGEVGAGQLLVQNVYMSVDPYMRGRMLERKSYVPPFEIGKALEGAAVGRVLESNNDKFKKGDYVQSFLGWREYFVSDGSGLTKVDASLAPVQAYLGVLGMTGMTAYFGLLKHGTPKAGETVFVSAASGAVGAIVCQVAKLKGCRVVGSAGSDAKVDWLINEVGIDAAMNYKKEKNLTRKLHELCPEGIDVYFENVGGAHFEAALEVMNDFGRVAMCGMISQYNEILPPKGPANLAQVIGKRIRIQGFIVSDHMGEMNAFYADMAKWLSDGKIKYKETIIDGIENAPKAFIGLFTGDNFGKMLVRMKPDATA